MSDAIRSVHVYYRAAVAVAAAGLRITHKRRRKKEEAECNNIK